MSDFLIQNYQIVTAWASLIIASVALLFTIYQAHLSRRHNRLSVKPSLTLWPHTDRQGDHARLKVDLLSTGLGPAVIKKSTILFDKTPITEDFYNFVEAQLKSLGPYVRLATSTIDEYAMPSNERRTLIEVIFYQQDFQTVDRFRNLLDRFDLICEYECFYGETQILDSRESSMRWDELPSSQLLNKEAA